MKTAVCMKYVPVIARMRFDYEARTIIREGVPSEVKPLRRSRLGTGGGTEDRP